MSKKSKFGASKLFTAGLAAVSAVMALSVSAFAEETADNGVFGEGASEVVLSDVVYPSLSSSVSNGSIDLRPGEYERYIDRVDLPEEVVEFYNKLCEWTDNDGVDDYLIDTSLIESQTVNLNGSKRNLRYLTAFEIVSDGKMTQEVYNYYFSSFTTAIGAFDRDHPEVFWLNGKVKSYYGVNDTEDGKKKYIFYLIVSLLPATQNAKK